MNAKLLGERVRALRKERNWSQEKLANKANVSQGTLSRIEHGAVDMRLDTLFSVAAALDTHLYELLQPDEQAAA